jgi:DNA-binding transcriptional MerR regulator
MAQPPREGVRSSLQPVDLSGLLKGLDLGIGQAAHLCGVSIRQLSYWTDKGIVEPKERGGTRTYDYAAIEKVCLIKQALDQGYSLEGASAEAEAFLGGRTRRQEQTASLAADDLRSEVAATSAKLQHLAERIRRGLRTYRVSGDLGRMAASLTGLEQLIGFLEANPYTVNTARQIALRVGREPAAVQHDLDLLEQRRFIQKISYPGADVYRYIPARRR